MNWSFSPSDGVKDAENRDAEVEIVNCKYEANNEGNTLVITIDETQPTVMTFGDITLRHNNFTIEKSITVNITAQ